MNYDLKSPKGSLGFIKDLAKVYKNKVGFLKKVVSYIDYSPVHLLKKLNLSIQ